MVGVRGEALLKLSFLAFVRPFGEANLHPFYKFCDFRNHRYLLSYIATGLPRKGARESRNICFHPRGEPCNISFYPGGIYVPVRSFDDSV